MAQVRCRRRKLACPPRLSHHESVERLQCRPDNLLVQHEVVAFVPTYDPSVLDIEHSWKGEGSNARRCRDIVRIQPSDARKVAEAVPAHGASCSLEVLDGRRGDQHLEPARGRVHFCKEGRVPRRKACRHLPERLRLRSRIQTESGLLVPWHCDAAGLTRFRPRRMNTYACERTGRRR